MSSRGLLFVIVIAVVGLTVGVPYLQGRLATTQGVADNLEVYIVQDAGARFEVEADGEVQADDVLDLSFLVGGQLRDLYVDEGSYVQEGDVIAVLQNDLQRVTVASSEAALQIAQLQLEDVIEIDPDDVALAEARIETARNSYASTSARVTQQDIDAAELEYQRAQAALEVAQQARRVGGPNVLDEEGIALLDAEIGEASFNAEISRLRLEDLRTSNGPALGARGADIARARADLETVLAGATEFQIIDAQLNVEAMTNALRQAEVAFERTMLRAPTDGIIADLRVEVGEQVSPADVLMQLVDIDPMQIVVEVDEIDVRAVRADLVVLVTLDALPGLSFEAALVELASEGVEQAGIVTFEATLEMMTVDRRILPGMSATAYFGEERPANTFTVPERFVQNNGSGMFALLVTADGTLIERSVRVSEISGGDALITSGLSAGDAVALLADQ